MRRPPELSLAQQHLLLRHHDPLGRGQLLSGRLNWFTSVQPSPLSRPYQIRIELKRHGHPDAWVLSPDLVALADGRRLPHVYSERPLRLCLWLPRAAQWHRNLALTETILPWANLWFAYFEEWLVSNEWQGGGEHPPVAQVA
jgi:hypothetical protein